MSDLSEFETRKQKIDILLREQGWDVNNRAQVILEVDTKQSDFVAHRYSTIKETQKNDMESRYVDYLLLDSIGAPLAIIEAKRTTRDPIVGQEQARQYAEDIKRQTGKNVFIFLTNGYEIWFWDPPRYGLRQVKGFHSQRDLERFRFQNEHIEPGISSIDEHIVNRPKSIMAAKRVMEHLHGGHRKALIVMATGTGKTRVAMAIIDALLKEKRAQKVLFLTDRKALRNQAWSKGFLEFFPNESKEKILQGVFDKNKRLYVSTIQTFMEIYQEKDENGRYLISPGEFDVIFSDEAHRSIYNKWKDVFTYLDAMQIGLTATPAELVDRDTFRFFNCDDGVPTALYSYGDAVKDGILCDFRRPLISAQTKFQIDGVRPSDLSEEERLRLMEKGIDPDEINFEGTELERKIAVKGTSEAIVREFMDNCLMDESGTLPAKTIFFAITKSHAKRIWEAFERLYPEHGGRLAQIIVSEDSRASDLIRRFESESFPRVAISVDMLDTGIDVPEVCNLVFAKPVFSKIKFWQMLGRGTRAHSACSHNEWLPSGHKDFFMVFDFWNNFEYWNMNPEGEESKQGEAITANIFLRRLQQLQLLLDAGDDRAEQVKAKVMADVRSLPMESVSVREKAREIEFALSPTFWDNIALDPVEYLKKHIMPLMRFKPEEEPRRASFVAKGERLALATLRHDAKEIERLKVDIADMVNHLSRNIEEVQEKSELLDRVVLDPYWSTISFEDAQTLISDVAPLMRYYSEEVIKPIIIDMGDVIKRRTLWDWVGGEPRYAQEYWEKVEKWVRELADENPVIIKIKKDEVITENDLSSLENALAEAGLAITEERLERGPKTTLVELIKQILELQKEEDPTRKVEDAFQTYMIENNKHYASDQLNFIHTIQTVFMSKRHIEMADLYEAPFTNFGVNAPIPMFDEEELSGFINICLNLQNEISYEVGNE